MSGWQEPYIFKLSNMKSTKFNHHLLEQNDTFYDLFLTKSDHNSSDDYLFLDIFGVFILQIVSFLQILIIKAV